MDDDQEPQGGRDPRLPDSVACLLRTGNTPLTDDEVEQIQRYVRRVEDLEARYVQLKEEMGEQAAREWFHRALSK